MRKETGYLIDGGAPVDLQVETAQEPDSFDGARPTWFTLPDGRRVVSRWTPAPGLPTEEYNETRWTFDNETLKRAVGITLREDEVLAGPPITEPVPAPEVYVDGIAATSVGAGVVRLPFFSVAYTPPEQQERRIVLRLAIPIGAMIGAHQALGDLVAQLKAQGVLKEQAP